MKTHRLPVLVAMALALVLSPLLSLVAYNKVYASGQVVTPQNTASLLLASGSPTYGTAADSSSLSITGNLTLETYFKANSLPTSGNSMTLLGKWDESGALRSYKMDLYNSPGYFGNGSDGPLTISADTTESPIDSACNGAAGATYLGATNVSFAPGQVILIHQTQGANAGQWERNTIQGYSAGTIALSRPLSGSYGTGAQVRVLKQYTDLTVASGKTWTAKPWNGTTGGILAFLANGTVTVTGNISAAGEGFRASNANDGLGYAGEGVSTAFATSKTRNPGDNAGGTPGTTDELSSGGGGGYGTAGSNGGGSYYGYGGTTEGSADLTTMVFGGAGGSGPYAGGGHEYGGSGAGIIFITGATIAISGSITANGNDGYSPGPNRLDTGGGSRSGRISLT